MCVEWEEICFHFVANRSRSCAQTRHHSDEKVEMSIGKKWRIFSPPPPNLKRPAILKGRRNIHTYIHLQWKYELDMKTHYRVSVSSQIFRLSLALCVWARVLRAHTRKKLARDCCAQNHNIYVEIWPCSAGMKHTHSAEPLFRQSQKEPPCTPY